MWLHEPDWPFSYHVLKVETFEIISDKANSALAPSQLSQPRIHLTSGYGVAISPCPAFAP